jgi:hypothetical protein
LNKIKNIRFDLAADSDESIIKVQLAAMLKALIALRRRFSPVLPTYSSYLNYIRFSEYRQSGITANNIKNVQLGTDLGAVGTDPIAPLII